MVRKHICFCLSTHFSLRKGGAEYQAKLLSESLVNEYKISYLYLTHNETADRELNGVSFFSINKKWVRDFKYFGRHKDKLFNLLKEKKVDFFYVRGFHFSTLISDYCNASDSKLITGISMDTQCFKRETFSYNPITAFQRFFEYRDRIKSLKTSDLVISQTLHQKKVLINELSIESVVIPNGHIIPDPVKDSKNEKIILWVANIKRWKRLEIFLDLASKFKDYDFRFVVIGRENKTRYMKYINSKINKLRNVDFLGDKTIEEVYHYLSRASVFINTSMGREGFPNTFVQAWLSQVPVISLEFDPDNLIRDKNFGFLSGDIEQMEQDLLNIMSDKDLRENMGRRARIYSIENYELSHVIKRYIEEISKL